MGAHRLEEGSLWRSVACGALAGAIAANSMTILRMAARRRGLIEKTVPQVMEEWAVVKLGLRRPGASSLGHHLLDQAMHVAYGGLLGALDGLVTRRTAPFSWQRGLALGVGTWALGGFVLMPLTRAGPPAWRSSRHENATNLLAHVVFGLAEALLTDELFRQEERGPTSAPERQATRVG